MNSTTPNSKISGEILLLMYLDGALDSAGVEKLNGCLRSDQQLRRYAAQVLVQQVHLRELAQEQPDRIRPLMVRRKASPLGQLLEAFNAVPGWWRWVGAVGAVAALVLFMGYNWLSMGVLRLDEVQGAVKVQRLEREWSAAAGTELKSGDRLILQPAASAVMKYRNEATQLLLSDSAHLAIRSAPRQKILALQTGTLSATVARQSRGQPMRLVTPEAEATVLGTELILATGQGTTRLEVREGKVQATRTEDGASVLVEKGRFVLVGHGLPMESAPLIQGLLREYWLDAQPAAVGELAELPCLTAQPSGSGYLANFDAPVDWGDAFVARIRGYLQAPVTGQYRFWIAGDDRAEFYLSSDDNPEHKRKVCWTRSWTAPREWEKSGTQQSALILLQAGRRYYLEALHEEQAGSDGLAVAWLAPGRQREIVPGRFLSPPAEAAEPPVAKKKE